jgi:hypothetical protein
LIFRFLLLLHFVVIFLFGSKDLGFLIVIFCGCASFQRCWHMLYDSSHRFGLHHPDWLLRRSECILLSAVLFMISLLLSTLWHWTTSDEYDDYYTTTSTCTSLPCHPSSSSVPSLGILLR